MKSNFLKNFLLCIFLCSIFTLQGQNPISYPLEFIQQPYDIVHYDALIDLRNGLERKISGWCEIKSIWKENAINKNFYFHLRDLKVDSVFFNSSPVNFTFHKDDTLDYSYYIVNNLFGLENDTFRVKIFYSGTMTDEGGNLPFGGVFLIDSILFSIGVGMNNQYVSTTQHWLPCYDHPSDKATYSLKFITPKEFTIATNGKTSLFGYTSDSLPIWESSSNFPIATYLLTFAMGKFKTMELDEWKMPQNIEAIIYFVPKDETAVQFAFKNFSKYFFTMQNFFGKYPFDKIGYVVVPFFYGAMEHQSMITFPLNEVYRLYYYKDTNNIMAFHEFSHQWFGNSVSPLDFRDVWFNEAFATYSEAFYLERILGENAYLNNLIEKKNNYLDDGISYEGIIPMYGYTRKPPVSNYPATIYWKGAVVVGMLRYYLGDENFFGILRSYLDLFAYQSRSTFDFINYCIYYTGENLNWFFDQWVFGKGYPILDISVKQYPKGESYCSAEIHIKQTQPSDFGTYIKVPIEFNFIIDNNKFFDTVIVLDQTEQIFWLDSIPKFSNFKVNQGKKVVSLFTSNNFLTVEDNQDEEDVKIFANLNEIIIFFPESLNYENLKIFDIFGNEVHFNEVSKSNRIISLNVQNFSSGVYYLTFIYKGKAINKVLTIVR